MGLDCAICTLSAPALWGVPSSVVLYFCPFTLYYSPASLTPLVDREAAAIV